MGTAYYSQRGNVGSVKSREGEISFQRCVAFPETVPRSFQYGPNHSVTQTLTKSSSEKGPGFMFSLVSAVPFSNVLTLSSTVLSVVWESFLHSETRGHPQVQGTPQLSQTPHPLPLLQKKMLPLVQLTQRAFSLFMRSERKIKKLCPESVFKSPHPTPPYPQLSPADCTFNVIFGSVLFCFVL